MSVNINIWKIIVITAGLIAAASFMRSLKNKSEHLTRAEFRKYQTELNYRIDTINIKLNRANYQLDTLRIDVDSLKRNTDTLLQNNELIYYNLDSLKKGQIIIYREVRKAKDKSLFEKIKLLLK
ncbi:MAG: hypothetical protein L3J56_06680 [Bacteroidales bacterium]|nr:hypothetical protein [Bacteroidales bacterium]